MDFVNFVKKELKRRRYQAKRRKFLVRDNCMLPVRRYGNDYGGFDIYETALLEKENPIIYSFGIGEDLSFSEALMNNRQLIGGGGIYAFDPTPRSIAYVEKHALFQNPQFHFSPCGLAEKDGTATFYLPANEEWVSGSAAADISEKSIEVPMECLNTIASRLGHDHVDLLKMDIEGSEFSVIRNLNQWNVKVSQICLEVHDRYFEDGIGKLRDLVSTLKAAGYQLIHISKSEDELTFVSSDII